MQTSNAIICLRYSPEIRKTTKMVMPVKPGKSPDESSSYRPTLLLPFIFRLFKKLFHKLLLTLITQRNIVPEHKFGFHSTHTATEQIGRIVSTVQSAMEENKRSRGYGWRDSYIKLAPTTLNNQSMLLLSSYPPSPAPIGQPFYHHL